MLITLVHHDKLKDLHINWKEKKNLFLLRLFVFACVLQKQSGRSASFGSFLLMVKCILDISSNLIALAAAFSPKDIDLAINSMVCILGLSKFLSTTTPTPIAWQNQCHWTRCNMTQRYCRTNFWMLCCSVVDLDCRLSVSLLNWNFSRRKNMASNVPEQEHAHIVHQADGSTAVTFHIGISVGIIGFCFAVHCDSFHFLIHLFIFFLRSRRKIHFKSNITFEKKSCCFGLFI